MALTALLIAKLCQLASDLLHSVFVMTLEFSYGFCPIEEECIDSVNSVMARAFTLVVNIFRPRGHYLA